MNKMFESLLVKWRSFNVGLRLAKKGKKFRAYGSHILIDGHVECGDFCRFRDFIILRTRNQGRIIIGKHVILSYYVYIESCDRVQIGNNVGIAEGCVIRDTNHVIWGTKEHFLLTPHITKPIIIGDNVFLGSRCYIHPGVEIGEGAVIGVNSVVTEDTKIGAYEVWAGVPARRIGHRTDDVPPNRLIQSEELIRRYGIRKERYQ